MSKERKGRFRFSTEIFRHLGEELNPHPDQGILELVKNAYDADARNCSVVFIDVGKPGGVISVEDDGDGMRLKDIRSGWLVLGESGKAHAKKTRLGRIPAGSKGLGRLAALRLGYAATLSTRPRIHPTVRHEMRIDWRNYKKIHHVDKIDLEILTHRRKKSERPGTEIVIEGVQGRFGKPAMKRLARQMILLADPFGDDPEGFKPRLSAPEFESLEKLVEKRYFDDADYRLVAKVDKGGKASAQLLDWRGEELYSGSHKDLVRGSGGKIYQCPEVKFQLWVFRLSPMEFKVKTASLRAVKKWLAIFGGVHVYYNDLRVNPYGNEGNDWLDMNFARGRETRACCAGTLVRDLEDQDPGALLPSAEDHLEFIHHAAALALCLE